MTLPRSQRHLLVRGGTVITMDRERRVFQGDVFLTEGRITELGTNLAVPPATRLLDASGLFVLPGLIQGHVHLGHRLFRGGVPAGPAPWNDPALIALEEAHDEETAYWSTLLGAVDCLRSGTTTVAEFGLPVGSEGSFRAVEDAGIRATVGVVLRDPGRVGGEPASGIEAALENAVATFRGWDGAARGRIRVSLNPDSAGTASRLLWERAGGAAQAVKAPLHIHLPGRLGNTAEIDLLTALGETEGGILVAHGLPSGESIRDRGRVGALGLVHCPSSEAKCGLGVADLSGWAGTWGARLGLGCDGLGGITGLDFGEELRTIMVLQDSAHGPGRWSAQGTLEAATLGGAGALGLAKELGSLEPGKAGDLVVLDLPGPDRGFFEADSLYARVVAGAGRDSVRWVVVDGEVVVEKGFLPHLDLEALRRKSEEAAILLGRDRPGRVW